MSDGELEDVKRQWVEACQTSDVGLWWVARDVRELMPQASEDDVRRVTLSALRPLLAEGKIRAVSMQPLGKFDVWKGSVDEQLARIDAEWRDLARPPDLGDVVWFIGER